MLSLSFGTSLASDRQVTKCIPLNIHPCQARLTLIDTKSNKPPYYPFNICIRKCGGSFNATDDPYPRICVLNKVKDINVKVLTLISRVNEMKFLVQHESRKCICKLIKNVCNSRQNQIITNVNVSVKNYLIRVLVMTIICGILIYMIVSVTRHVKLLNI